MIYKHSEKLYYKFCNYLRNSVNRVCLKKQERTIISSNCIGGLISHWLKLRFNSPTVNLFIQPKDFIQMLKDFDYYFDPATPIIEVETDKSYPVGAFEKGGVRLWFMHYDTFDNAVEKWRERCTRINKEQLYIMMVERDGCTINDILEFDELPYNNKVVFTHKNYEDIKSSFYIHGFENDDRIGHLHTVMNKKTGKRYIDQFDYVGFLNR